MEFFYPIILFMLKPDKKEIRTVLKMIRARVFKNGVICPRCGGNKITAFKTGADCKKWYYCPDCRKKNQNCIFHDLSFTVFRKSKIPFDQIFLIAFLFMQNQTSSQIKRTLEELGVFLTVKTVWRVCLIFRKMIYDHIIRTQKADQFTGVNRIFEIDELYIKCKLMTEEKKAVLKKQGIKRGVGSEMTVCLQCYVSKETKKNIKMTRQEAKEKEERREIFFHVLPRLSSQEMNRHFEKIFYRVHEIHTDDFRYKFKLPVGVQHHSVKHSKKEYVRGRIHTNTAESVNAYFRACLARFKCVSLKNLYFYIAEFVFKLYQKKKTGDFFKILANSL